jgi:putative nucleotidyltransferase with HDIG domain
VLSPQGVHVLAKRIAVVDFFEQPDTWQLPADHLRLHAVAVQAVADRVARELDYRERDRLAVVSLLHDVGKLVLAEAYGSHEASNGREPATPEARLDAERREFGIDHAVVGGVLLRRWGLPDALATSVERHHDPRDDMTASIVRVADMIAHYRQGRPVDRRQLIDAARRIRLDADAIRSLMYEGASIVAAPRAEEPSPLSAAQTRALRLLAEGKVYKEIAAELQISPSTVRSHLHATYSKLGVADRAQAVLRATEQGWL